MCQCQIIKCHGFLSYLHSILQLGNQRVAGNELKESTLHPEGHGHNQGAEEEHLEDEKSEDLCRGQSVRCLGASNGNVCGPVRRSNSWWLDGSLGGCVLLVWCGVVKRWCCEGREEELGRERRLTRE
jgi:hypothetical protein